MLASVLVTSLAARVGCRRRHPPAGRRRRPPGRRASALLVRRECEWSSEPRSGPSGYGGQSRTARRSRAQFASPCRRGVAEPTPLLTPGWAGVGWGEPGGFHPMRRPVSCRDGLLMITVDSLTRRYAGFTAVDNVSFTAQPGRVTGFLGPNGAGKSTTMRVMVGLTAPTSGSATIDGVRFADLPNPGLEVGVLLDACRPARGPHRPRDPHRRRRHHGPAPQARRRDARAGQPDPDRGQAPRAQLLTRHAPAPRHRHRTPRRPPRC